MSETKYVKLYRFIAECIQLADMVDERKETPFADEVRTGYAAFSGILRQGVKEIIDLKQNLYAARERAEAARISEEDARNFLEECFGDREIDSINEEDRKRILFLCDKIRREWEEKED